MFFFLSYRKQIKVKYILLFMCFKYFYEFKYRESEVTKMTLES